MNFQDPSLDLLDPHVLYALLETASQRLSDMATLECGNWETLEEMGSSAAKTFSETLSNHKSDLKLLHNDLNSAMAKLQHVSRPAACVEHDISLLDTQVRHVEEAAELLDYISAFSSLPKGFADNPSDVLKNHNSSGLPLVYNSDEYGHTAQVMAKLRMITRGLEDPTFGELSANVRAYSDVIEEELLMLFEQAVQKEPHDIGMMKHFVDALFVLNGGEHIPGRYAFIVVSSKLSEKADEGDDEDSLRLLFDQMKVTCCEEFDFINRVFPPSLAPRVTMTLLQLVLSDPVHGITMKVQRILSPPTPREPRSLRNYLDLLSVAVKNTRDVFDVLKYQNPFTEVGGKVEISSNNKKLGSDGENKTPPRPLQNYGDTVTSGRSCRRSSAAREPSLLSVDVELMMQLVLTELRVEYPNSEMKFLLQSLLNQYESIWEDSLKHVFFQGVGKASAIRFDDFPAIILEQVKSFKILLKGPLEESVIDHVLALVGESIRRCQIIMAGEYEEEGELIGGLWASASRYISYFLVGPCVSAALQLVSQLDSDKKGPLTWEFSRVSVPPPAFYDVISACIVASKALKAHFTSIVLPAVNYTPTQRTVVTETNKTHVDRIDSLVGLSLQRALEMVSKWVGQHLSKKRGTQDYAVNNAKGDPRMQPAEPTLCMIQLCKTVKAQYNLVMKCLPEVNLSEMWSAFGLSIVQRFMDYLKNSKGVTATGGFILAQDVNEMQDMLRLFDSAKVDTKTKQLRSITNLYIIPAENIKGLVEGDKLLSQMPKSELKEYAKQRADWQNSIGIMNSWSKELFFEKPL